MVVQQPEGHRGSTVVQENATVSSDPKGNGILKLLKDPMILQALLLFGDLLPHLSGQSLFLQRQQIHLGMVKPTVDQTLSVIDGGQNCPQKENIEVLVFLLCKTEATQIHQTSILILDTI